VTDESGEGKKKGGFFRKLMKLAMVAAIVTAVVQVVKRRRGQDLDDVEWQELPPPAGG
jgi:negative regulator of sigma E activity